MRNGWEGPGKQVTIPRDTSQARRHGSQTRRRLPKDRMHPRALTQGHGRDSRWGADTSRAPRGARQGHHAPVPRLGPHSRRLRAPRPPSPCQDQAGVVWAEAAHDPASPGKRRSHTPPPPVPPAAPPALPSRRAAARPPAALMAAAPGTTGPGVPRGGRGRRKQRDFRRGRGAARGGRRGAGSGPGAAGPGRGSAGEWGSGAGAGPLPRRGPGCAGAWRDLAGPSGRRSLAGPRGCVWGCRLGGGVSGCPPSGSRGVLREGPWPVRKRLWHVLGEAGGL